MCIRDSHQKRRAGGLWAGAAGGSLGLVPGGQFFAARVLRRFILLPVSYTHLDVYKRQLLLGTGHHVLAQLGRESARLKQGHLDARWL